MQRNPNDTSRQPRLLRWFLSVAKRFGWEWLPEDNVRVYYRKTRYAGVKEPNEWGLYRLGWLEMPGPVIYTGAYAKQYEFDGVTTRDHLNVRVVLSTLFNYDPRENPKIARVIVRIPQDVYPSIAETYFRVALMVVANKYTATELNQAKIKEQAAEEIRQRADQEMRFLGMHTIGAPRILRVDQPARMTERFETDAQRRVLIGDTRELDPAEFRRAVATELMEGLARKGAGDTLLGFKDVMDAYVADAAPALERPTIEHIPPASGASAAPPTGAPGSTPSAPPRPRTRL